MLAVDNLALPTVFDYYEQALKQVKKEDLADLFIS